MELKICNDCKIEKPVSEFSRKRKSYNFRCKICQNLYAREHYLANKERYLAKAKKHNKTYMEKIKSQIDEIKNNPCTDCKQTYHPCVMDFDHLTDKHFGIGYAVSHSFGIEKILKEIEKCELVCSNCHRIRTFKRSHNEEK